MIVTLELDTLSLGTVQHRTFPTTLLSHHPRWGTAQLFHQKEQLDARLKGHISQERES